jgi:hypothetical protein
MASVAVFVALGGGAYAAVHVNGKDIENRTIAGKKLRNNTLGGKQINEHRLGEVPRAARAGSAATAASVADSATTATSATRAGSADTATTATRATTADTATTATNAANAATLGGDPPSAFLVSCPAATTLYGGVCWDDTARGQTNWFIASVTCGDLGGRLPSLSEIVAYVSQPGNQIGNINAHWSSDIITVSPVVAATALETGQRSGTASNGSLFYRCVFYRTN